MKYCINLESFYLTYVFRFSENNEWKVCLDSTKINQNDYATKNPQDLISLQKKEIDLVIEGDKFEVHPEMGLEEGNEKQLCYELYGFRQFYPSPPQENQLKSLLLNGDDSRKNTLILKTDGKFYLLAQNEISHNISDPNYVVRFQSFLPNNKYVGETINDNGIDNYIQNIFKTSIQYWITHLKYKNLDASADYELDPDDQIPDILELFDKLLVIEKAWVPAF